VIKPQRVTATVVATTYLDASSTFLLVTLSVPQETQLIFMEGQYCTVLIDGDNTVRRSYSIASVHRNDNTFDMLIEVFPEGKGAQYMAGKTVGESIELIIPFGRFVLQPEYQNEPQIFIATGSGIAPIKPMIERVISENPSNNVELFWGMRYAEQLCWLDEFLRLQEIAENFTTHITLSKPSEDWSGLQGRVTQHLTDFASHKSLSGNAHYYLCGGKQMITEVTAILTEHGVTPSRIITEQFYS
jgi:NAD(P)H-flavin reductase